MKGSGLLKLITFLAHNVGKDNFYRVAPYINI